MPSDKPLFESRDPGLATVSDSKTNTKKYLGQERRRGNRRQSNDRRNDVRFEINKTDRREDHGRREEDSAPTFW